MGHACLSLDMPRARKKKLVCASGAKDCARTRSSRGTKCRREEKDGKDTGMGGAVSSQEDNPPSQENPTSLQKPVRASCSTQTPPLPLKPECNKMCPKCFSLLKPVVVPAGRTTSLLQCPQCCTTPLCEKCLYPCPEGTCTNQSCQVVALLLTCDQVTDSTSNVYGCPLFRACPKCHNLMMHHERCKYVSCAHCKYGYCFICLRTSQECIKDVKKYWSLTCSVPRAARQRFQT